MSKEVNENVVDVEAEETVKEATAEVKDTKPVETEKKEGFWSKTKRGFTTYVIPAAKTTGKVVGKVALGAASVAGGIFAVGMAAGLLSKGDSASKSSGASGEAVDTDDEEFKQLVAAEESETETETGSTEEVTEVE